MNVLDERATKLGVFIVENKATVRRAAKQFGVSKSTVHMEVTKQCGLYGQCDNEGAGTLTVSLLLCPVFTVSLSSPA